MEKSIGKKIYSKIKHLFPINRSLTGDGNRRTLRSLKKICKQLKILEFSSGKSVFDWKIPVEWNLNEAHVTYKKKKIIDSKKNNLHIVSYSHPIKKKLSFKELDKNLYSIKKIPNAIPYVTSYYKKRWGFCLTHNQRSKLDKSGSYLINIDSKFKKKGSMSIGEIIIKGDSKHEIIFSTNICHPSMVNNELCAPVILTYLAKYFNTKKSYFTLRFVFFPETIGAITYLNKNLKHLKKYFRAGFHLTCFGDKKGEFSIISTKYKNSYSDSIARKVLNKKSKFKIYDFKNCGSDERQYNFPGIDLPVVTLTKSKFGKFKEYHNSLDNMNITNPKTLEKSYNLLIKIVKTLNNEKKLKIINKTQINLEKKKLDKKNKKDLLIKSLTKCEPFLSKRKLYRDVSESLLTKDEFIMFNLLYYGDGISLTAITKILSAPFDKIYKIAKILKKHKLVELYK